MLDNTGQLRIAKKSGTSKEKILDAKHMFCMIIDGLYFHPLECRFEKTALLVHRVAFAFLCNAHFVFSNEPMFTSASHQSQHESSKTSLITSRAEVKYVKTAGCQATVYAIVVWSCIPDCANRSSNSGSYTSTAMFDNVPIQVCIGTEKIAVIFVN